MPAFNQVIMIGNLTGDPQISFTPNQTAVADFALAVNRKWTGQDGSKHDETCFIDVRGFGKLADLLQKYTQKGSCVQVCGYLVQDRWEKDGQRHSKHRITAERVTFLSPRPGGKDAVPDEDIPI